jgi:hypothetical protein
VQQVQQVLLALALVILPEADVVGGRVGERFGCFSKARFNLRFVLVGELVAVASDEFDAVIVGRVMRSGEITMPKS